MKKARMTLLLVFAASVTLAATGWYEGFTLFRAAPAPSPAHPTAPAGRGDPFIVDDASAQRASGIETAPLVESAISVGQAAYVTVVDSKAFIDLHKSYATAQANRDAAKVQAQTSEAQYERQRGLYKESNNASLKSMQDAQAAMAND